METRREVLILAAGASLLTSDLPAADAMVTRLFGLAVESIGNPTRVREKYAALTYYMELLRQYPPSKMPKDVYLPDAEKTYAMIREQIAKTNGKPDGGVDPAVLNGLIETYEKSQHQLWEYLKEIGISPTLPADLLIEEAIATSLVFYVAATKFAGAVANLSWCIYPFCFKRPT